MALNKSVDAISLAETRVRADWTQTDRSQGLDSVPLFEEALDIYRSRMEMKYQGDSTAARPPAPEYLIAYWFGRKYAAITAAE